jgi:hypothetical protein
MNKLGVWSLIHNKKTIVLFENTAMQLWSHVSLQMQGDACHHSWQGGGPEKNNQKWMDEVVERHKGSLTQKKLTNCGFAV